MKIEFVCRGNTFRSRLAEAYFKSKQIQGIEVSSSGTYAQRDLDGPITWWAQRIIDRDRLVQAESRDWRQVTPQILAAADLVIFFEKDNYEYCRDNLGFVGNFRIWEVPDIGIDTSDPGLEIQIREQAEDRYLTIKGYTDRLVEELGG